VARAARARPRVAIRDPVALAAAAGSLTAQDTPLGMKRSIEMVVAIFGGRQAGAADVPLDPGYPPTRLAFMGRGPRRRPCCLPTPFVPAPAGPGFCLTEGRVVG
jgi:hypothetical protein